MEESNRKTPKSISLGSLDNRSQGLKNYLKLWPNVLRQLENLSLSLKREKIINPYASAKSTLELLRYTVGTCKWTNAGQLMEIVKSIGRELMVAKQSELVVSNIVKRVLFVIREEYSSGYSLQLGDNLASDINCPSLEKVLGGELIEQDFLSFIPELKQNVIEGLNELKAELEDTQSAICEHAWDTIHANEIILTRGYSSTVENFLISAYEHYAKKQLSFSVIVVEAAPTLSGHAMAKKLAETGIEATVINDSAVYAIMSRVNKVIMATNAVVANGGLVSESGSHMIALAAHELCVPVVCVAGMYKLCPLFPHDQDTFNFLLSPVSVLSYKNFEAIPSCVEVLNPAFDYIPPELVSLYMTNIGGHQPSYIYRLLAEYYHRDDYTLSFE
mmetsp:Transcript_14499/g.21536  ORF Transcript_14499/g.21536 Transcript_14499/m.21536 type:complete len:388 (+) Transcript_14499:48-1211(+)